MRRALAFALLFVAANAFAAEKWWDAYNRGTAAVNARRYADAQSAMQAAIAANPNEGSEIKVGTTIIGSYLPHFWLGIAKYHLGDIDGALREWRISEEQGAVARTPYFSQLKNWVQRGQLEKQRLAEQAASGPRKAAESAISRAVQAQGDAMGAGGDRTESYRDAQRRLQDALARFRQAGTNAGAYESIAETAEQATQRFAAAAEEGKRLKAAAKPKPQPPAPKPIEIEVPFEAPPVKTETVVPVTVTPKKDPPPVVVKEVPVEKPAPVVTPAQPPAPVTTPVPVRADVTPAYRAFAMGDLVTAERLLTAMLAKTPAAEAYLLRGCVRYTQATLSRAPEPLLAAATNDFKAALARNRYLRLDPSVFSPKLVRRFEQVRNGR
jgi:tetratricopeptide (TPR) repeat protein